LCWYYFPYWLSLHTCFIRGYMKKINILTLALLGYLLVMSYIGWPGRHNNSNYTEYFTVIGVTVVVIFLLRFLRIRLYKTRNKRKEDKLL
jgi:phosphotransferase system  glucose/maltose/N-acetylglucosamine-specific IIC component